MPQTPPMLRLQSFCIAATLGLRTDLGTQEANTFPATTTTTKMYHVLINCQALHIPRALISAQITLPLGSECCSHHPKWSGMSLSNLSKDDKQGTVAWLQSSCSFFPGVLLNVCTSTTVLNPSAVLKAPTSRWQPWGGPLSPQAAPRCCITYTCPQAKGGRRGRQRWWQLTVSATNKNILKGKRSLPEQ